jgi:hypothetical protein
MGRIKTLIPDLKILKNSIILIQDIQALKKLEFSGFANVL